MIISKTSLHYRLVRWYNGGYDNAVPSDICRYVREIVFAIFVTIFCGAMAIGLCIGIAGIVVSMLLPFGVLLNHFFHWFPAWVMYNQVDSLHPIFQAVLFLGTLAIICGVSALTFVKWQEWNDNGRHINKEPTVVGTWYKSFKDKTCALLEFK